MECLNYKGFPILSPSTSKVATIPRLLPELLAKSGYTIRSKTKDTPKMSDYIDSRAKITLMWHHFPVKFGQSPLGK
jgi:hypothetical protein